MVEGVWAQVEWLGI